MIKIKTDMFKALLSNAVKVCSFDKMLPLTELIELKIEDNMLFIKTTDNINTLILKQPLEGENDNMRVVVDANLINNLVNKITTEFTELLLTDNTLLITGNGTYNLELRVDESGEIIKFPEVSYDEGKAKNINILNNFIITPKNVVLKVSLLKFIACIHEMIGLSI